MKLRKRYWIKCNKCKIFVFPKISYIFNKTLTFSNICSKCGANNDGISEFERSIAVLIIPCLTK